MQYMTDGEHACNKAGNSSAKSILIVGGGVLGSLLCLALQQTSHRVMLCDASNFLHKQEPNFDARSIALNQASIHILSQLRIWEALKTHATPIQTIHVSSQHQFGSARLGQDKTPPLGYVVEMHRFFAALKPLLNPEQLMMETRLTHYDPKTHIVTLSGQKTHTLRPDLIVAAEGTASSLRTFLNLPHHHWDYQQHAIVANIELKRPHQALAIERFTPEGPLALLPLEGKRSALVWCLTPSHAKQMLSLTDQAFLKALQTAVGYRLGRLIRVGQRMSYPLTQQVMPQLVSNQVVFVGNAAQTLHPVAGQGLNLGLRDVATLAQCLVTRGLSSQALKDYQVLRTPDRNTMIKATHDLVNVFTHRNRSISLLRSLALMAFDCTHLFQSDLIRHASGFGALPPDLACDISLQTGTCHAT